MSNDIMVSVVCLAYNHEKYIRHALEGFVSQKTSFRFEVIVHDDASTDHTADIIREYADQYPEIIKPIFQTRNQYSRHISIHANYIVPAVKGKYIALCEGDDYWTSPQKLQKQFEAMEANDALSICLHKVQGVSENGEDAEKVFPDMIEQSGLISTQYLLDNFYLYPFHTSSYFMKAALWKDLQINPPKYRKAALVGDEPMLLYMAVHGGIYYIHETCSCYRMQALNSWSAKQKEDLSRKTAYIKSRYNMMCEFDESTGHKYDCHLSMYRGRMFLYEGKYSEIIRDEGSEFFSKLSFVKKAAIILGGRFHILKPLIMSKLR